MAQNRSSAVMQQRVEPRLSLDFFPTPPWATRALCERLVAIAPLHLATCWEPACGAGDMARPLAEYFDRVVATDVHDYGWSGQSAVGDFLLDWAVPPALLVQPPDWVITNPPFRLAAEFVAAGLRRARVGCAVLVRTSFLEGAARYRTLFAPAPPALVLQFVERVPILRGRLDPAGSPATSYCWLVWWRGAERTALDWIAPCRRALERQGDYPEGVRWTVRWT